jgi:hypothetical protein
MCPSQKHGPQAHRGANSDDKQVAGRSVRMNPAPAVFAYSLRHLTSQMDSRCETTNTSSCWLSVVLHIQRLCAERMTCCERRLLWVPLWAETVHACSV